jgi:hypothetical protein
MNELTSQTNEPSERSGRVLNELNLRASVEQVEYVSLTSRADFYNNERVFTVSSSSSNWAKPCEY